MTEDEKKHLSVKLQDLLAKAWTLVGIPLVVTASAALAKVEKKNYEGTVAASNWYMNPLRSTAFTSSVLTRTDKVPLRKLPELTPESTARGTAFMKAIYRDNLEPILTSLGTNSGLVEHVDKAIVYGLFLADHSILSELETSLVCVASIMCQGLRAPTGWHIRGLRRLGASEDDVRAAERAIKMVAEWTGKDTEGWATLEDIRDQV